jgi:hypothetical protein
MRVVSEDNRARNACEGAALIVPQESCKGGCEERRVRSGEEGRKMPSLEDDAKPCVRVKRFALAQTEPKHATNQL